MVREDSWSRRHRRLLRWSSVVVPIAVVAFILIGTSDIVPVTFSGSLLGNPSSDDSTYTTSLPPNVNVSVHWAMNPPNQTFTRNGHTYYENGSIFGVLDPNYRQVCYESGTSGACSFVSMGGNYTFRVYSITRVNFTATYYTSLL